MIDIGEVASGPPAPGLRRFGPGDIVAIAVIILAGNLIGAALVLIWARLSGTSWRELGFVAPPSWVTSTAGAIIAGVGFDLVMKSVVMPLLGAPAVNPTYHYLTGNPAALPAILFTVIIGGGFGEETIWRGFLFNRLGALLGRGASAKVATVLITAALFSFAHYHDQGLPGAEMAMITGIVFGTVFARTGRLWPVMVAHAAFDVSGVLIIYWDMEQAVARAVFRSG